MYLPVPSTHRVYDTFFVCSFNIQHNSIVCDTLSVLPPVCPYWKIIPFMKTDYLQYYGASIRFFICEL